MSVLRDEIRAILREELAALRHGSAQPAVPVAERVSIPNSAALNRFARDLLERAASPEFSAQVARGDILFELVQEAPSPIGAPMVTGPARARPDTLDKKLITERDISGLEGQLRSLRIARHSRLTPLARDEARRRGIRIERVET